MSPRTKRLALLAAVLATFTASTTFASWGPDGATILSTTQHLSPVSACSDGAYGAIVTWNEAPTIGGAGVLKALHVLADGNVDPAWPASGVTVCSVAIARGMVGSVGDATGGGYVWWKEGSNFYVSRLDATGAIASNWPARGRLLGAVSASNPTPHVIADGAGSIYAVWGTSVIRAIHLGPGNVGAGGWPNAASTVLSSGTDVMTSPAVALASDGIYVAGTRVSTDPEAPHAFLLRRLTTAGAAAPGWSTVELETFDARTDQLISGHGLIDIAPDGANGVYVFHGKPQTTEDFAPLDTRLHHFASDGSVAAGWPVGGTTWTGGVALHQPGIAGDGSVHVVADRPSGVKASVPTLPIHSELTHAFGTYSSTGVRSVGETWVSTYALELLPRDGGGFYTANCKPLGPMSMYDGNAFIAANAYSPASSITAEYHWEVAQQWFGDVAIAPSGDGGVLFFWSQNHDRFGLFGRRFNESGEVLAVEPGLARSGIESIRFAAGAGVRARIRFEGSARLDLFDVSGRRVASQRFETGNGEAFETTLAGTERLRSGLFFARLTSASGASSARVVISQ